MKVLISHPTSNQFNRSALAGLLEKRMLGEFHTSVASFPGDILSTIGGFPPLSPITRRKFTRNLKPYTHSFPFLELGRIGAGKLGLASLLKHEKGPFCLDAVYRELDSRVSYRLQKAAIKGVNGLYAYEDGAYSSFLKAKTLGMSCFYDLPIGYWRAAQNLLQKEQERWPEWSSTITSFTDSSEKLERKDKELALSDRIFVASSFTARTLKHYPGRLVPIEVIPYGFPPVNTRKANKSILSRRKLKLLFVGGLSQRKGIADLFAAVEKFKDYADLTIVGQKAVPDCAALNKALEKHTWIKTLPHEKILDLMKEHDVLIFPSLFEGFGLVITEAMSQGTPVITTERTAGPDIICHQENGWLIKGGSTNALEAAIEELLLKPNSITRIGKAAMDSALLRPWEVYGRELVQAIVKHRTNSDI